MKKSIRLRSFAAALAGFALIAAACTSDDEPSAPTAAPTTTVAPTQPPETTAPGPTATTSGPVTPEPSGPAEQPGFTYTLGIFEDIQTANFWAYFGPDTTVWTSYVLGPTKPSLYQIVYPAIAAVPDVAAAPPPEPTAEGENWTVSVDLRNGYEWSDGEPVTAADVQFTFETVRDATLGGNWLSAYPYSEASSPRLLSVTALSDTELKLVFDERPGLAVWPHNVGTAPIMPKHAWEATVDTALTTDDPASAIYGADPSVDVSGGATAYVGREEGSFARATKNNEYYWTGTQVTQYDDGTVQVGDESFYGEGTGDVIADYTVGPFLSEVVFSLYTDQPAALLALQEAETDFLLNPVGMARGLLNEALADPNLRVTINAENGFSFLGFNLKKSPGSYLGYRQAIAFMIDKEFFATNVVQGAVVPVYVLVPEGNEKWYNEEIAAEIASRYVGLSQQERVNLAVAALQADGFTWTDGPQFDEEGNVVLRSMKGLIDPEGSLVSEQEILATPTSYDPLRASISLWIEGWAEELGIPATANPTDFNTLFSKIWPGVGVENTFDMFLGGWGLGNPALPTFHQDFFHSRNLAEVNDGLNAVGYVDEEFDRLADSMFTATSEQEIFDNLWLMEQKIAGDLPYVVLYTNPIVEFHRADLLLPFMDALDGLQAVNGAQRLVAK